MRELRPLTALRFVAAVMVFVEHCTATSAFGEKYALGHAGVGFFFVLSGFILTYSYQNVFTGSRLLGGVRDFYAARFARVYPAYVVATLITLVVLGFCGDYTWDRSSPLLRGVALVAQLALVQSWIPVGPICLGINSPAWSVSTEAFFYAVFPFVANSFQRSFRSAALGKIAVAALLFWSLPLAIFLIPHSSSVWETYIFPPVRFVDFAIGMLCAIVFIDRPARVTAVRAWTVAEVAAIAGIVALIAVSLQLPDAIRYSLYLVPAWGALIVVAAYGGGLVSRLLATPLLVQLGRISFAFYLLHWPAIAVFSRAPDPHSPLTFAATFALTLGGSFALYYAVERPLRGRIRRALSDGERLPVTKIDIASTIEHVRVA